MPNVYDNTQIKFRTGSLNTSSTPPSITDGNKADIGSIIFVTNTSVSPNEGRFYFKADSDQYFNIGESLDKLHVYGDSYLKGNAAIQGFSTFSKTATFLGNQDFGYTDTIQVVDQGSIKLYEGTDTEVESPTISLNGYNGNIDTVGNITTTGNIDTAGNITATDSTNGILKVRQIGSNTSGSTNYPNIYFTSLTGANGSTIYIPGVVGQGQNITIKNGEITFGNTTPKIGCPVSSGPESKTLNIDAEKVSSTGSIYASDFTVIYDDTPDNPNSGTVYEWSLGGSSDGINYPELVLINQSKASQSTSYPFWVHRDGSIHSPSYFTDYFWVDSVHVDGSSSDNDRTITFTNVGGICLVEFEYAGDTRSEIVTFQETTDTFHSFFLDVVYNSSLGTHTIQRYNDIAAKPLRARMLFTY
jgi:hypothetical protein